MINQLARSFAVCDRWFASVPTQTWPNRAFVHAGASDGHINNDDYELYDIPTIFNVLEGQGKSWSVFHDTTLVPSLTFGQFLGQLGAFDDHFHQYDDFKTLCQAGAASPPGNRLPVYSFVEPRFTPEPGLLKIDYPSDYHPPHNVCRGEQFLADVYQAVRNSPYRDKILLVITFDEHGGCYDHVPPPSGAAAPMPSPKSRDGRFDFSRYGARVPTIVISSYVQPGTVFRAGRRKRPTTTPPFWQHCGTGCRSVRIQNIRSCRVPGFRTRRRSTGFSRSRTKTGTLPGPTSPRNARSVTTTARCKPR